MRQCAYNLLGSRQHGIVGSETSNQVDKAPYRQFQWRPFENHSVRGICRRCQCQCTSYFTLVTCLFYKCHPSIGLCFQLLGSRVSKETTQYFQEVISSSHPFNYFRLGKISNTIPCRLVEMVGCGGRSGRDLHSCLQLRSPEVFIEAQNRLIDPNAFFSIPFPPVLDGHFLPYWNSQSFAELGYLKPTGAVMLGMNANEGSYFLLYKLVSNKSFVENREALPVNTHEEYFHALYKVLDITNDKRPDLMEPLAVYTDFEYRNFSEMVGFV